MTGTSVGTSAMSYETFRGLCESLGRAGVLSRFTSPLLLVTQRAETDGDVGQGFGFQTTATPLTGARLEVSGPREVVPVAKRESNRFASMITVGRATNNDVHLDRPSVSKFHAYFMRHPKSGVWHLLDASSSNGTFVNGVLLRAERNPVLVKNGDELRFGGDVAAVFLDPGAIYDLVRP